MPAPGPAPRPNDSFGLVRRLLGLSLEYRRECSQVFALQVVLLALGVMGLGLSGVAIDVVRAAIQPGAPAPRWPLELAPSSDLTPKELLIAIGAAVLCMALFRALLSYTYQVLIGRLVHLEIVPELRTRVFDKLQRLSFRFFERNADGSIINRVRATYSRWASFWMAGSCRA